jgi:hypothetical protein
MSIVENTLYHSFVNIPFISRIRRNHGLEHATLNVLAEHNPNRSMAGYSNFTGFWLIGDIPTEEIRSVLQEAQERLGSGEHHLAIHPNCGTNFVAAGTLAGLAGLLGMIGVGRRVRDKLERLPLVATLATLALIVAQPLGTVLQKYFTTSGDLEALEVVEIIPTQRGRMRAHRIITRG